MQSTRQRAEAGRKKSGAFNELIWDLANGVIFCFSVLAEVAHSNDSKE
jgi:hypothetical protein